MNQTVVILIACCVLVIALVVGGYFMFKKDDPSGTTTPTTTTSPPTGAGASPPTGAGASEDDKDAATIDMLVEGFTGDMLVEGFTGFEAKKCDEIVADYTAIRDAYSKATSISDIISIRKLANTDIPEFPDCDMVKEQKKQTTKAYVDAFRKNSDSLCKEATRIMTKHSTLYTSGKTNNEMTTLLKDDFDKFKNDYDIDMLKSNYSLALLAHVCPKFMTEYISYLVLANKDLGKTFGGSLSSAECSKLKITDEMLTSLQESSTQDQAYNIIKPISDELYDILKKNGNMRSDLDSINIDHLIEYCPTKNNVNGVVIYLVLEYIRIQNE